VTDTVAAADDLAGDQPSAAGHRLSLSWLGVVPFFAYVGLFLLLPTGIVVFQAFFNAAGQPTLTYLQASRNTFIELMPAPAGRAAGFTHFGVHVDDVQIVAARLRERGMDVGTPRIIGSGSLTVAITDPDGNRLELSELGPDAPARKAMNAWK